MPPHKPNRYEVELQKNLDDARESLANKAVYIADLESRISELNARANALEQQSKVSADLRETNRQLAAEIVKGAVEAKDTCQKLRAHELAAIFSKKTIRDLENQNAALRAALREVL